MGLGGAYPAIPRAVIAALAARVHEEIMAHLVAAEGLLTRATRTRDLSAARRVKELALAVERRV